MSEYNKHIKKATGSYKESFMIYVSKNKDLTLLLRAMLMLGDAVECTKSTACVIVKRVCTFVEEKRQFTLFTMYLKNNSLSWGEGGRHCYKANIPYQYDNERRKINDNGRLPIYLSD